MLKKEVLRRKGDFSLIYKRGKSIPGKYNVLFFKKNGLTYNRIAFLASKKVGNSVQRNRAKRLMKESYRLCSYKLEEGYDLIVIARNSINGTKFDQVNSSVLSTLHRANLIKK